MRRTLTMLASLAAFFTTGCYSFSNYQSARLLDPGRISVTPSLSSFDFSGPEDGFDGDFTLEGQVRAGVTPGFEIGVRVSRIFIEDGYEFAALEPKVVMVPDHLAFALAIGTFLGEHIHPDLQLHPTIIASLDLQPQRTELVFATKALFFDADDAEVLIGFDLGMRFSTDLDRWAVHPEVGWLFNPGEEGHFFQFGLGVMSSFP